MVLPGSRGIPRVPRYSGTYPASQLVFVYRALTVYGRPFQVVRLTCWFFTRRPYGLAGPTTPTCKHIGLGCSAFARRYLRNHYCFLFLQVLRWFTSLRCLLQPMDSAEDTEVLPSVGFPIRKSSGQRLFPAYRSLSQVTTSFIDSWRQGIHRTPLVAWPYSES